MESVFGDTDGIVLIDYLEKCTFTKIILRATGQWKGWQKYTNYISNCFRTHRIHKIRRNVERIVALLKETTSFLKKLLFRWLSYGLISRGYRRRIRQGCVFSSSIFNAYLEHNIKIAFDDFLRNCDFSNNRKYADDTLNSTDNFTKQGI